jgi:hypothetical protein
MDNLKKTRAEYLKEYRARKIVEMLQATDVNG